MDMPDIDYGKPPSVDERPLWQ